MLRSNDSLSIQEASTTVAVSQSAFTPIVDLDNGVYSWTIRAYDAVGNVSGF